MIGGGYAEYALAPEGQCMPVPDGVSLTDAAGLPEVYCTVWTNMMDQCALQAGETVLIQGGTSGIGRRVIERFTEEGAKVAFTGRRADLGAEVASVTGASFIQGDAGNADDAANVVATAIEQLGGLDILMNNAGAPAKPAPFEDLSLENFDATMAVHVPGVLGVGQYAPAGGRPGGGACPRRWRR